VKSLGKSSNTQVRLRRQHDPMSEDAKSRLIAAFSGALFPLGIFDLARSFVVRGRPLNAFHVGRAASK